MAEFKPIVAEAGQLKQLQSGSYVIGAHAPHTISADYTIPDGVTLYVPRYVKIAAGVRLKIGADADLEIG